jgi:6-phosphogluconolactonase
VSVQRLITRDAASLSHAVADAIAEGIAAAIDERARAVVAFSGGSTPAPMLRELSRRALPWERVTVFQVDERVAPDGHDDRNATMLLRELLDRVAAVAYLMPVTTPDLDAGAADYAALLGDVCGGVLDVVHLGLGPDGHTASLVPGDPVLQVRDRDVATTGEYEGRRRMTLTYPALNRARRIVWEVSGADKADAVLAMVEGRDVPGAVVAKDSAVLIADAAAAARLPG